MIPPLLKIILKVGLTFTGQRISKKRFGIFRHGNMDDLEYTKNVIMYHFGNIGTLEGANVLELGPGESLTSGIILKECFGDICVDYLDVDCFANETPEIYQRYLSGRNISCNLEKALDRYLEEMESAYFTNGIQDLEKMEDQRYDFVFSQAVMEHVLSDQLSSFLYHIQRVLKPGGVFSSQIDFSDHLGGRNYNLRFSDKFWNSTIIRNAGFYTNRISPSLMTDEYRKAGFSDLLVSNINKYRDLTDVFVHPDLNWKKEDLEISSFKICATKR